MSSSKTEDGVSFETLAGQGAVGLKIFGEGEVLQFVNAGLQRDIWYRATATVLAPATLPRRRCLNFQMCRGLLWCLRAHAARCVLGLRGTTERAEPHARSLLFARSWEHVFLAVSAQQRRKAGDHTITVVRLATGLARERCTLCRPTKCRAKLSPCFREVG